MDLLMLPGMDGTGALFAPFCAAVPGTLSTRIVVYPSDREIGYDELLPSIAEHVPKDPYVVLGDSFSGPLALRHAASRPDKLRAVVLVATFATNPAPFGMAPLLSSLGSLPFRVDVPKILLRWLLTGFDAPSDLPGYTRDVLRTVDPGVLSHRLREVFGVDVRSCLAKIRVPVLYLLGARDQLVRPRSLVALRSGLDDLTVVTIDSPHLVLACRPELACDAILEFLREKRLLGDGQ